MQSHGLPNRASTFVQLGMIAKPTYGTSTEINLKATNRHSYNTKLTNKSPIWLGQFCRSSGWEFVSINSCKFYAYDCLKHNHQSLILICLCPFYLISVCMGVYFLVPGNRLGSDTVTIIDYPRSQLIPHDNQSLQIAFKTGIVFIVDAEVQTWKTNSVNLVLNIVELHFVILQNNL